ncbi:hypothetical protein MMC30_008212 [Trapelia coarctata]|nr:hypothetical protein [Trapelia coarctata]
MPWIEDHVVNGSLVYSGAGMLVMAIEAAKQMADATQGVAGFELRDTLFQRPLKIPRDTAGIETQLSLHLRQDESNALSTWSEFRLCAYENNQWHECCQGFVRVIYEAELSEVDEGKEESEELKRFCEIEAAMMQSCQGVINPESLYEALRTGGFEFGPTFRTIVSGAFSDQGQTKGDIKLFDWPGAEHPQPHVIHPTSLDGMFHLAVAGFSKGGQKNVPTMVPTSLRNIWISANGLSHPDNRTVTTCGWMTTQDIRGAEFDGFALNSRKSAVLAQISGLRLTTIAQTPVDTFEDEYQNHQNCYHIEHCPDPGLLRPNQASKYCQATPNQDQRPLDRYFNLLMHKNPGLNIIEVGGEGERVTVEMIAGLSLGDDSEAEGKARSSSYCYTASSQLVLAHAREIFQRTSRMTYGLLNIEADPAEQSYEAGAYDVVVAGSALHAYQNINTVLKNIRQLLNTRGKFIFCEPAPTEDLHRAGLGFYRELREKLSKNGFSGLELDVLDSRIGDSPKGNFLVCSAIFQSSGLADSKEIVFVTDSTSTLQADLSERLTSLLLLERSVEARTVSLQEASSMAKKESKIFIVLQELDRPFLYTLSSEAYMILREFLVSAQDTVWINSYGGSFPGKPEFAMISGLAHALRNEYENHRFTTIAIEFKGCLLEQQLLGLYQVLVRNHIEPDPANSEPEYIEIDGMLHIPRFMQTPSLSHEVHIRSIPCYSCMNTIQDAPPLSLTIGSPGLLNTLHFIEDTVFYQPLADDEVEIRTQAIGMNFKDCLTALGQISNATFGLECAGIVTRIGRAGQVQPGDRVLMATAGSFRTFARGKITSTCKMPDGLSFAEAAAIPAQFGTAWEVIQMARLQKGETILVHAGAGGTGQAAIQVAKLLGGIVFATVGLRDKKQLLVTEYGIPEDHIFYSRNTSFAKGIKRVTKDRGVDVIINSLAGDSLIASWECIAPYGRFIEIGKKDIMSNSNLPMYPFRNNASFIGFDGFTWQEERPIEAQRNLQTLVDLVAHRTLQTAKPLHVYSIADVEKAFRLMQQGKTAGKIVLEVRPEAQVLTTVATKPSFFFNPKATYVIAGGLGGLGRSTVRWMIGRDARNFILLSRSGPRTEIAHAFLKEVRSDHVRVEAPACDITDTEVIQRVLGGLALDMLPIKGCIQASMVAKDKLFTNMEFDDWQSAVTCKTVGSWSLHTTLPRGMDFFILHSSASGLAGLRGQANYAAGNTYEDALARYHIAHGEKVVSLDLGAMTDDGILAENPELLNRVLTYGALDPISRQKFFAILDYYCNPDLPLLTPRES